MENADVWQPKIVAFLCNWCSYAGADLAGVSRLQYGPNVRIIRVPCSARINPQFIIKALQNGADRVLVSGCHPGDCHYISGNLVARRKFALTKKFLEYFGIEPERVRRNAERLLATREVWAPKLEPLFQRDFDEPGGGLDPDLAIYAGGFFSDQDRDLLREVVATSPAELAGREFPFRDSRLPEMLFRYRARSYPQTLNADEAGRWREFCAPRKSGGRSQRT